MPGRGRGAWAAASPRSRRTAREIGQGVADVIGNAVRGALEQSPQHEVASDANPREKEHSDADAGQDLHTGSLRAFRRRGELGLR